MRFEQERGYVVTFKKTDPLFVLEFAKPAAPRVVGQLKILGFSTYMHRIDHDHLLSIGYDADDKGDFSFFNGIILQLFDVRQPTEPKLLFKETLGTRGTGSEAATNHLAFNYFAARQLLAIPVSLCEGGGNGQFGDTVGFSGLLVYKVTAEQGFQALGRVSHAKRGGRCEQRWWSDATSTVKRSVFIDERVYSLAPNLLKVQSLGALGTDLPSISLAQGKYQ